MIVNVPFLNVGVKISKKVKTEYSSMRETKNLGSLKQLPAEFGDCIMTGL